MYMYYPPVSVTPFLSANLQSMHGQLEAQDITYKCTPACCVTAGPAAWTESTCPLQNPVPTVVQPVIGSGYQAGIGLCLEAC